MTVISLRTRYFDVRAAGAPAALRPHISAGVVQRQQIPYWQQRGWRRSGDTYSGTYQTRHGSFIGIVEDRGFGDIRFYLSDPPDQVRRSCHWACFQPRRSKGYQVHMSTRPADISSGILTIERLVTDAFEGRG